MEFRHRMKTLAFPLLPWIRKKARNPRSQLPVRSLFSIGTHSYKVVHVFCPFLPVGGQKHRGFCKYATDGSICTAIHRTWCMSKEGRKRGVVMEIPRQITGWEKIETHSTVSTVIYSGNKSRHLCPNQCSMKWTKNKPCNPINTVFETSESSKQDAPMHVQLSLFKFLYEHLCMLSLCSNSFLKFSINHQGRLK